MSDHLQNNTARKVISVLSRSKNPLCMIDDRLDFDAFCSALAMRYVLKRDYDINLRLTYIKSVPTYFSSLLGTYTDYSSIETEIKLDTLDFGRHDLLLYLDSADMLKPTGFEKYELTEGTVTVNIDHHVGSNNFFGDYNFVKGVPSTCTLLFEIFSETGVTVDKTVANLLLLGLLDDTQVFSISDVRNVDLSIASELLTISGTELFDVIRALTWNVPREVIELRKIAYRNLIVDYDLRVAYTHITLKDLNDHHIDPDFQTNVSIADEMKVFSGIDVSFLVKEKSTAEGIYTVSIRPHNPEYNASEIASHLGGGGHEMAAGGKMRGMESPQKAIENMLGLIQKYRSEHNLV